MPTRGRARTWFGCPRFAHRGLRSDGGAGRRVRLSSAARVAARPATDPLRPRPAAHLQLGRLSISGATRLLGGAPARGERPNGLAQFLRPAVASAAS
jgi:hypothetical protein